jgi:ATP synthase protein I
MSRNNEGAAWTILGYLLSGPLFWGGVGYGLDAWLGTGYFLASGLLLGMGAALYLVWLRFGREKSPNPQIFDFAQSRIYT